MQPQTFFDLDTFEHSLLFHPQEMVWEALGRLKEYLLFCHLGAHEGVIEPGAHLISPETISIAPGAYIEAGAYIRGPCIIGEKSVVRHGAYIRGNVIVGKQCVVGHSTEVKNAIFLDGAQAGHFAYIGDSILGNGVNLGAGTKCANLRLDREEIVIKIKGKSVATQRKKLGAIFGDHSQTGCNVVTNPGTLMGKGAFAHPLSLVSGVIEQNGIVKGSANGMLSPSSP